MDREEWGARWTFAELRLGLGLLAVETAWLALVWWGAEKLLSWAVMP